MCVMMYRDSSSSSFHSPIPLCQSESLLIKVSFVVGKATSHAICTLSSTHMIPGGSMNAGQYKAELAMNRLVS